jgi:hypothetical protein
MEQPPAELEQEKKLEDEEPPAKKIKVSRRTKYACTNLPVDLKDMGTMFTLLQKHDPALLVRVISILRDCFRPGSYGKNFATLMERKEYDAKVKIDRQSVWEKERERVNQKAMTDEILESDEELNVAATIFRESEL